MSASLAAAFTCASVTSAPSISTPVTLRPGTRAARHRLAVPAPLPSSNAVWPFDAGMLAASITASRPARNPASGCVTRTRPSRNVSVITPSPFAAQALLRGSVRLAANLHPPPMLRMRGRSRHGVRNRLAQQRLGAREIAIQHHQPARQKAHAAVHHAGMGVEYDGFDPL